MNNNTKHTAGSRSASTIQVLASKSLTRMVCVGVAATLAALLWLSSANTAHAQLSIPGLGGGSSPTEETSEAATALERELAAARSELAAVEAEIVRISDAIQGADATIARIRAQLAADYDLAGVSNIDIESLSRSELEALILEQNDLLASERERVVELDATLSELFQAPSTLESRRETSAAAPVAPVAESSAGSGASPSEGEADPTAIVDPAASLATLRQAIAQKRAELVRNRLVNNEKLTALYTAERDAAQRVLAQREAFLEMAVQRLRMLREEEASRSVEEAREAQRQTAFEPLVVRNLAEEIVALKEELAVVSRRGSNVAEELQEVSSRRDRIRDDFTTTRDRVDVVGSSPAIGRMLRRRLAGLPSIAGYRRSADMRRIEISEVIDRQIDIDEELRQLAAVNVEVTTQLSQIEEAIDGAERERLRTRIENMLVDKRGTLAQLQAQYGSVAARLTQLDQAQRDLVTSAREFVEFIEGELMTIPSQPALHNVSADIWITAVTSVFDASVWERLLTDIASALLGDFDWVLLVALIALTIFLLRRWARREVVRIAPLTRKIRTDRMRLTIAVLGYSLILSAFWPTVLAGSGWILQRAALSEISISLGTALVRVGAVLLIFGFVRQMVRSEGLALRHFRWTEETCRRIIRNLYWFLPLETTLIGIKWFTFNASVPAWNQFSRIAFFASMVLIVVFFWRITMNRRARQKYTDALTEMTDPLAHRPSRWFVVMSLVLLFSAMISIFGYHYTAMRLDYYFSLTVLLLFALMILHNLLLRWSTLVQRRLRFVELLKRREEARASRDAAESDAPEGAEFSVAEETELDVVGLGEQTRRVMSAGLVFFGIVGLYLIWDDLFPALRVLDEVKLPFSHVVVTDGIESQVAVTLTDFGVALLVFVATFIGARNLPGLLEFVLLQRLPIDAGARYATITIARYIIVAVGVVTGFGIIGADWSKLQWLIAALGVGLGFGLQEIVANFVSGIILLFERPIRVGDVITLGDTDGVVTRIRIRATTIRNWDQKELIVPNKEFITGRLLNWTLSDSVNRMVFNVGIAYGSDVDKALEIMLDAAVKHPHTLDDPRPVVVFEGFGNSSLDLTLRCYQSGLEWRLTTLNEINGEINRRFKEAGIEIPFPQRDLHLRSSDPLSVVIRPDVSSEPATDAGMKAPADPDRG